MKSYCTQNGGECGTCSLANYGRDCRNAPLGEEGGRMTHAEFTHEMLKAKTVAGHPSHDLAPGTLNSILKQAGIKGEG